MFKKLFIIGIFLTLPISTFAALTEPSGNADSSCFVRADGVIQGTCANTTNMDNYLKTQYHSWIAEFDKGATAINGVGVCSTVSGANMADVATSAQALTLAKNYTNQVTSSGTADGQYCWCKMEQPGESAWLYLTDYKDTSKCENECTYKCMDTVASNAYNFRTSMYATISSSAVVEPSGTGDEYCYLTLDGKAQQDCKDTDANNYAVKGDFGNWAAVFKDYDTMMGISVCGSVDGGTVATIADATTETVLDNEYNKAPIKGNNCWCKMESPGESSWAFLNSFKESAECANTCTQACASEAYSEKTGIRHAMFSSLASGETNNVVGMYFLTPPTDNAYEFCSVSLHGNNYQDCKLEESRLYIELKKKSVWAADFNEKDPTAILGVSACSVTNGVTMGTAATAAQESSIDAEYTTQISSDGKIHESQQYCWCKMESPGESSWVFLGDLELGGKCAGDCSMECADTVAKTEYVMRTALYATIPPRIMSTITTKTYVDDTFSGKQSTISGTNGKIVTYGSSTGATPGSRDIVSTLGTSTTATTVPETGAVTTGLNTKQTALNGTSGYVATGTGTAGSFDAKPVYNATTANFYDALLTVGSLNTGATDAANAELMCTRYIDNAPQTDANCLLWGISSTRAMLSALVSGIDGSGYCYKRLSSGYVNSNNTCINEPTNYADWGTTFTYNGETVQVSGISACSSLSGSYAQPASNQAAIQADYESNMASAPTTSPAGQYCYCKLTDPSILDARWVLEVYIYSSGCAASCAEYCALDAQHGPNFRAGLFGINQ